MWGSRNRSEKNLNNLVRKLTNLYLTQSQNLAWEIMLRALPGPDKCTGLITDQWVNTSFLCAGVRQAHSGCSQFVMQTSILVFFPNFLHFLVHFPFICNTLLIAWSLLQFCWCGAKKFFQYFLNTVNIIRNFCQIFKILVF